MKKTLISTGSAIFALALSALPVIAAETQTIILAPNESKFNALRNITIPGIISGLISLALVVAALIFFFMLVIGGIQWMLSGGDKAGTEAARGRITAALIGLVVVFSAWAIVQLIKVLFNVDILGGLTIPTFTKTAPTQ